MQQIYLANTDFEFELAHPSTLSIEESWAKYPLCLQLQFLPLLYAQPQDAIAVMALPDEAFMESLLHWGLWQSKQDLPNFVLLDSPHLEPGASCLSWGYSQRIATWTNRHGIHYDMPSWDVVQRINSKAFTCEHAPRLEGSALLWNLQELEIWLNKIPGPKVLKTCFGLAGKGNRLIESTVLEPVIKVFCEKEWKHDRPIIGEPWLNRVLDFSTQWMISKQGHVELIGPTRFETHPNGAYQGTLAGPKEKLFQGYQEFLSLHIKIAYELLSFVYQQGFWGHVGLDALLYKTENGETKLYPIVELNGRQTMSLAALHFQRKWFPEDIVCLKFQADSQASLLPSFIMQKERRIDFKRALTFTLC